MASLIGATAMAAAPEAGSVIGNQATATYTNAAGDTITVTVERNGTTQDIAVTLGTRPT